MVTDLSHSERTYYASGGIRVTANRLHVLGETYPIFNLLRADTRIEQPNRTRPILCIIAGILLLILLVGIPLLLIGIYWFFSQKPTYWLVIYTPAGSQRVHHSGDAVTIGTIQSAVTTAIAHNRITLALVQTARHRSGTLTISDGISATGMAAGDLEAFLNDLVAEGYATSARDPVRGTAVYGFERLLWGMDRLREAARSKRGELSIREVQVLTGMDRASVQPVLDSLERSGYAIPMIDRYGGTFYRFNEH